jgi:hypothetical protein
MKTDGDKYGFFMRLEPNEMGVVAEGPVALPAKESHALLGAKRSD